MVRLRIFQAFISSILLIGIVALQVSLFDETYWVLSERMIDDLALLLFMAISTLATVGSLLLNVRLLAGLRPSFYSSSRLLPQIALVIVSASLLYLIASQEIIVTASYDAHLSRYDLLLTVPRVLSFNTSFFPGASITLAGDGTQVVVFFFFLFTSSLIVGIYNTGWRSSAGTLAKCLTSTLVFAHITVGLLVAFWAIAGFLRLYSNANAFSEATKSDPGVMNSSNVAYLAYLFVCYSCLGVYAQWLLRDGWSLASELKRAGKLRF